MEEVQHSVLRVECPVLQVRRFVCEVEQLNCAFFIVGETFQASSTTEGNAPTRVVEAVLGRPELVS